MMFVVVAVAFRGAGHKHQGQQAKDGGLDEADVERRMATQGGDLAERLAAQAHRRFDTSGSIDEVRISNVARSAAWVKFEYYNMNGLVLNPVDWQTLETAKATDGHYLMVSMPTDTATQTVWRIPVVITNAMTAGTFLIGDFTMGAVIYDRENISVRVSESHGTLFVENGVAILGEERYTLAIPLPKAFCKGAFTVAV